MREEVRAGQRLLCVWSCGGMKMEWLFWAWWREPLLMASKVAPGVTCLWPWVPAVCVYLPKCQGNSVSITQKHLKCVFSFLNSSLKNQRIEWWKQKLKTNPNKPNNCESHQFWVMGDGNRVMSDGKQQIQTAPKLPLQYPNTWSQYGPKLDTPSQNSSNASSKLAASLVESFAPLCFALRRKCHRQR